MCPNPPSPESVESGVGSPTNEWMLVGVVSSHELGTSERVMQLEKIKQRKTDHGKTVVTCSSSWYYKCSLSKTLTISLLLTSPSPIQEGLVPFCLLQFRLLIIAQCCFAYSCKMWLKQCETVETSCTSLWSTGDCTKTYYTKNKGHT